MHSILIALTLPATDANHKALDDQYAQDWAMCCQDTHDSARKYPEIKILAGNVFLIPAKTHLHLAAEILEAAKKLRLTYQTLVFDEQPDWIESPNFRQIT